MSNFYQQLNKDKKIIKESDKKFSSFGEKINKKEIPVENVTEQNKDSAKKLNFLQYQDTTGELSGGKLKKYLWISQHRVLFYRLLVWFLSVFIFISFAFSIWKMFDYLVFGLENDNILYRELTTFVNYNNANQRYSASPIQILSTDNRDSNTGKFDVISELFNPNERFFVEFDFYLDYGDKKTEKQTTFLLPLEYRPVAVMGLDNAEYSDNYNFVIENIRWQRISNHKISDLESWMKERENFIVNDVRFISKVDDNNLAGNFVNFNLINDSAFNYRAPNFIVGLYQSGYLSGVLPLKSNDFFSGENKSFSLRIFANYIFDEIQVYPVINLFDNESYLEPSID